MKKRTIIAAAITACLALCAAMWPQAETVGETPTPSETTAVIAPQPTLPEAEKPVLPVVTEKKETEMPETKSAPETTTEELPVPAPEIEDEPVAEQKSAPPTQTDPTPVQPAQLEPKTAPESIAKAIENKLNAGVKNGIIWHTQGSGKTALAYYNVRYLTDYYQKHGTIAKFYFIVDRLDLLTQAANEFRARGLHVEEINSKEDFIKNIHSTGTVNNTGKPTITVVNIQKFSKESIAKQSDYAVNVQRIYFLDEAHRSYKPTGSFLANLLSSDREAVMIALTGTPLIGTIYDDDGKPIAGKKYDELVSLFEEANLAFLQAEHSLFRTEVAERTLCGALMLHIHDIIKEDDSYSGYYADVEYNRNAGGIKTIRKTIRGQQEEIIPINCDLILHSRGENVGQDNLIAIEMKKSNAPSAEKQKDRERLIALTKDSFDDVWAWDHNLPEHVCRYVLGVYYEINYRQKEIYIEYYRRGELVRSYSNHFVG